MLSLIVGAALLGIIIAVMEEGEFPGWFRVIACALATLLPKGIVNAFLPNALSFVGAIVGAVIGGFAISALCGMSVQRASIAAGIWLVLIIGISFVFRIAV
jgi:hypothetical protein